MAQIEVNKDKAGEYRWWLCANNGKPIVESGESYVRKSTCTASE